MNRSLLTVVENQSEEPPFLGSGSEWLRWDPHIHAPNTLLNNQFGAESFDAYIAKLEEAVPVVKALGVTDYYLLECYEAVKAAKDQGKLGQCDFIFANVEMRLAIGTVGGSFVNVHLLISPDDPNHIEEAKRFLNLITFQAHGDTYSCNKLDLIRLGRCAANDAIQADSEALAYGATQFKVSLEKLKEAFTLNKWARENILIGVAGNQGDGTSGVRDSSDVTMRKEIENFAHIIFSATPNQREFWLGKRSLSAEQIKSQYGSLKPCLHGSDAHEISKVAVPDQSRYTWIKGRPSFDTLMQACIDPEGRAFIGENPPVSVMPSQAITSVSISGTEWVSTPNIKLNAGLVTIIGARGSGKTALAEMIAAGCKAIPEGQHKQSFLIRAEEKLGSARIKLQWGEDPEVSETVLTRRERFHPTLSRARYLSQQFVEELCSSEGVDDKLIDEMKRVIFDAHTLEDKSGTTNFEELLELKANRHRSRRVRAVRAMETLAQNIGIERDKLKFVPSIKIQIEEKTRLIEGYRSDLAQLANKGSEAELIRIAQLNDAIGTVRGRVRHFTNQHQALLSMTDEINDYRKNQAPANLRDMQDRHSQSGVEDKNWQSFLLDFKGDVEGVLAEGLKEAERNQKGWQGSSVDVTTDSEPLIKQDADLNRQTLGVLEAEINRLSKLVNANELMKGKFLNTTSKISSENVLLENLRVQLKDYEGATDRLKVLRSQVDDTYKGILEAIIDEEQVLKSLYAPITSKLESGTDTLRKMAFVVQRKSNFDEWVRAGEELVDLREAGPFKGKGGIKAKAEKLQIAWESGSVDDISKAMQDFKTDFQEELVNASKVKRDDPEAFKQWAMSFSKWLYCTDHIEIIYSIEYEGIDISKLSPGTRGIVLLLIYLALDTEDDRPLIIDQPEENLDPKSVYDELVGLFIQAKGKRQVIMVTHNANLVVNTDADQIIIASMEGRASSGMPNISYISGGLEEAAIRKEVCNILEGGAIAFAERARRLRVTIG